jgi:hypothetical protein
MTSASTDRRQKQRHIVVGVSALVDGEACPIADISATAVRLLRPNDFPMSRPAYILVFTFDEGGEHRMVTVSATLVRYTESCFVLEYAPPFPTWETFIRSADTLEQTKLSKIFD